MSGGTGATLSPFHINISHKCEKACKETDQGGIGSDRFILRGALLHSLRLSEDALLKDSSVITGVISKRLFKQKDLPTNPKAATDFTICAQLFFLRHQPCKYMQRWTITRFQLALHSSLYVHKELQGNDFDCKPSRAKIIFMGLDKYTTRALFLSPSELQGEISKR